MSGRCAETGMELTTRSKTTGDISRFEDQDALSRFCQVGGAHEAVVAGADNDGVETRHAIP